MSGFSAITSLLSGGSSTTLTYYFSGTNSSISGYESLKSPAQFVATTEQTKSLSATTTPAIIEEFATDAGYPNITRIVAGTITCHYEVQKAAGSNNYYTYAELYKRNLAGTETLLLTSDSSSQSALNTRLQTTVTFTNLTDITILTTDRLVVKIYAVMASSTATINLYWDNNTAARLVLPYVPADATNFVPYTGATTNVTLGTNTLTAGALYATSSTPNIQLESAAANAANAGTITFRTPSGSENCTLTFDASANIFNFKYGTSTFATMTPGGFKGVFDQGNVSTPSVRFTNYGTTGLYMPSANVVAATISGSQMLQINQYGIGVNGNNPGGGASYIATPSGLATNQAYGWNVQNATDYISTYFKAPDYSLAGGIYGDGLVNIISGVSFSNGGVGTPDITIQTGNNWASYNSGNIYITGHSQVDGGTSAGIYINAGSSNSSNGGELQIHAGACTSTYNGGDLYLSAGLGSASGSAGYGNLYIDPGYDSGGSGAAGYVRILSYGNQGYLSFFGVSGTTRVTTAISGASYSSPGAGTNVKTDDTFGGYTIAQLAKALLDYGLLS